LLNIELVHVCRTSRRFFPGLQVIAELKKETPLFSGMKVRAEHQSMQKVVIFGDATEAEEWLAVILETFAEFAAE
jgi:hypothetical protein